MSSNLQKGLLLSASVLTGALGIAAPAMAQDADDIVVTARRVEERLQDVPISIQVFNQQDLTSRNVISANDLAQVTPGLTANARYGADVANFQIRGAVQESRTTASVATYFADVVALRGGNSATQSGGDGAGPGAFFDLQNVQVLRGPQGTLFGRNTTGGAVLLVPQRPGDEFGGYIEGSFGDFDLRREQGVLNLPVTDNFRLRAGFDTMKREGYTRNIAPQGPDRYDDVDYGAGRLSALWDITPNIENYTVVTYSKSDTTGSVQRMGDLFAPATGYPSGRGAAYIGEYTALQGTDVHTVYSLFPNPESRSESWQLINRTTWNISDNLTLTNIASYGELKTGLDQDPYSANFIPAGFSLPVFAGFANAMTIPGGDIANQYTATEELRLNGVAFNNTFDWQAGIYFEKSDSLGLNGTASPSGGIYCTDVATLDCPVTPNGIKMQWENQQTSILNKAIYAQGTYHVTPQLSATAGIRYTVDRTTTDANLGLVAWSGNGTNPALQCILPGTPTAVPAGPGSTAAVLDALHGNYCRRDSRQGSDAPTWLLGLDYKPMEDVLLFAKYTRGYRQGSTNPFGAFGFEAYGPETMNSYEIGFKTAWHGSLPGHFNFTGFQNEIDNAQVTAGAFDEHNGPSPFAGLISPNSFITNGQTKAHGFEIDAGITVWDRLHLGIAYGYTRSTLVALDLPGTVATAAECTPLFGPGAHYIGPGVYQCLRPQSIVGRSTILTPETQYTITASFDVVDTPEVGKVTVGGSYTYVDDQVSNWGDATFHSPTTGGVPGLIPHHELVNLNFNWIGIGGSPVDLGVFGTNVLDEKYISNSTERAASSGFDTYSYGAPAMWGMRLRYNFGAN